MDINEILKKLEQNNEAVRSGGQTLSIEQLRDFTRQLSVNVPDTAQFNLLYSGSLTPDGKGGLVNVNNEGLFSWQVAKVIAETRPNLAIVDNTPAMNTIFGEAFDQALENTAPSTGLTKQEILFGSTNANGIRNPDGLVDDISRRFVTENAEKPIIVLTPLAGADSVYSATELPQIMSQNGGDIAGLPRALFQDIYNSKAFGPEGARLAIAALSAEQAVDLKYEFDDNGRLAGVDASAFWSEQLNMPNSSVQLHGDVIISQADFFAKLTPEQTHELAKGIKVLDDVMPERPALGFIEKLGKNGGIVTGVVVGSLTAAFTLATTGDGAQAAEVAYEMAVPYGETQLDALDGDMEAAKRSATIETVSNISSGGGALAGAAIGTAILPGVGTVVGAGVGAIAAGIASGEATAFVYDHADDIADWWDESDDELLVRLPTEIDESAPPELQHLVEIKRMLVEAQGERSALGNGRTRDNELQSDRRALTGKIERIEQMYDEAYDTYDENGALASTVASLDNWERAEKIAQHAIENLKQTNTEPAAEISVQHIAGANINI